MRVAKAQLQQHKQEHGLDYGLSAMHSELPSILIGKTIAQCTDKWKKKRTST
jgi:hypothetical protein